MTAASGDAVRSGKDIVCAQRRRKNFVDEALLRLAFNEKVEADQCDGLPPTTFFSHNSEIV